MKNHLIVFIFLLSAMFISSCQCKQDTKSDLNDLKNVDTTVTEGQLTIKRYEKALFGVDRIRIQEGLKRIKGEFGIFLDGDLDDPANVKQLSDYIEDPFIQKNYEECEKQFPDLTGIEKNLFSAFKYYLHYFPDKKTPSVYTYVSGMDFEMPIKFMDTCMIIALDMYLGPDFSLYASCGIPLYKRQFMTRAYIVRDCMEEVAYYHCYTDLRDATFLDQMIFAGKVMYFLDVTMPAVSDTIKMKYSLSQLNWCESNEASIWSFFIDNQLLYGKDPQMFQKFFIDGPFTTSFGKDSPPRTGAWVGWQIVRRYMAENKSTDLKIMLLEKDSQKILKESGYKPKK